MVGYDFDDTVMKPLFKTWWMKGWFMYPNIRNVKIIITSRRKTWVPYFWLWIWGYRDYKIFFRKDKHYNRNATISDKFNHIRDNNITQFVENDEETRQKLALLARIFHYPLTVYEPPN